jgi:MFS family permease
VTIDTEREHGSLHIFADVVSAMVHRYPRRTVLSLSLMVTQAFLYNAIFFTEALVLSTYFHVPSGRVGLYIIPFALGNLVGPWVLGHAFDAVGRRPMIAGTYILSGLLLAGTALLFWRGALSATTITVCWSITFFFASAGAMAPAVFGAIIATHSVVNLSAAYLLGVVLMIVGGLVEVAFGGRGEVAGSGGGPPVRLRGRGLADGLRLSRLPHLPYPTLGRPQGRKGGARGRGLAGGHRPRATRAARRPPTESRRARCRFDPGPVEPVAWTPRSWR